MGWQASPSSATRPFDPAVERLAIDQHALVDRGAGGEHALHVGMEALEGGAQHLDVAHLRPRFAAMRGLGLAGDEVDLAAVGLHRIHHDVAVLAPPFGAVAHVEAVKQARRIDRAIGDAAGEMRIAVAEQAGAHDRVDAVGADQRVRLRRLAVGES